MAKTVEFTVTGRLQFPVDMLRHDMCYPVDSNSAIQIGSSHRAGEKPTDGKWWVVKLRGPIDPTAGRWESFGWLVKK